MGIRWHIIRQVCILVCLIVLITVRNSDAAWTGPAELVSGSWGNAVDQFGLQSTDTMDFFPRKLAIDEAGRIYVPDQINGRVKVYDSSGTIYTIVNIPFDPLRVSFCLEKIGVHNSGSFILSCPDRIALFYSSEGTLLKKQVIRGVFTVSSDGYYFHFEKNKYDLYSTSGELIKQVSQLPSSTVPTSVYEIDSDYVSLFNICGNNITRLDIPESKIDSVGAGPVDIVTLHYEYGEPFLAPNGDIYTWKRTPEKYSILKWTWEDDPNTPPAVPGPPTIIKFRQMDSGLQVRWGRSPQDKTCVTGYEVARSDKADGPYTVIGTSPKGIGRYLDTTAEIGKNYYYKIRAKGDNGYSAYNEPLAGTRQAK